MWYAPFPRHRCCRVWAAAPAPVLSGPRARRLVSCRAASWRRAAENCQATSVHSSQAYLVEISIECAIICIIHVHVTL